MNISIGKDTRITVIAFVTLLFFHPGWIRSQEEIPCIGQVYSDSATPPVRVYNLKLNFEFAGYGVYKPADYPTIAYIPLETGESVNFSNIVEATFTGKRVQWKKYIPRENRSEFKNLDASGYYYWTEVELVTSILDLKGNRIKVRMKKPEMSDVALIGQTDRGTFRLKLNEENGKTVKIIFHPAIVLQCTRDPQHVYSNPDWKFCPIDGAALKVVEPTQP